MAHLDTLCFESPLDGRGPSTTLREGLPQGRLGPTLHEGQPQERLGPTLHEGKPQGRLGPTTRSMTKRVDEDWNKATDGRETYLYMFQESPSSVA